MTTLYERIGGEAAILAAVEVLYQKLLADPVTRPFFESLEMDALVKKQIAFLSWAFGGPDAWKGRDLRAAHRHLVRDKGLDDLHFQAVAKHLEATLSELGIERSSIDEALRVVAGVENEVLDR